MNEETTLSSNLERIKDAVDDIREITGEAGTIEEVVSAVSNLSRVPEIYFVKDKEEMEKLNAVSNDLCLVRDNTSHLGAIDYIESHFTEYPYLTRRIYFPENIKLSSTLPVSMEHSIRIEDFNNTVLGNITLRGSNNVYTFSITSEQTDSVIDVLYTSADGCIFHRDRCAINGQEVYGFADLPFYLSFYNDSASSILEIHEKCMRRYEIKPWTYNTKSENLYLRKEVSLDEPIVEPREKHMNFPNGSSAIFHIDSSGASIIYDNSGFSFEAEWTVDNTGKYMLQKVSAEGSGIRGFQDINYDYNNAAMNIILEGITIPLSQETYFESDASGIDPFLKFLGAESNTITDLYKYNGSSWDIISLDE